MKKLLIIALALCMVIPAFAAKSLWVGLGTETPAVFTGAVGQAYFAGAVEIAGAVSLMGTFDLGTSGTHRIGADNDNYMQLYVDFPGVGAGAYNDGIQDTITGTGGDGTGAIRAVNIVGQSGNNGSYAELYGLSCYAMQNDGTHTAALLNLYNMMMVDNEDVTAGDVPTQFYGNFGIVGNTGGAAITAPIKGGLVGCVKDATNNDAYGVVSFFEGDSGLAPNNPDNAYFKAINGRSTATDIPAWGIDFHTAGSAVPEVRTAEIRGQNQETISNLADGSWAFDGTISPHVHIGTADSATQNMVNCNVLLMPSSVNPLAITDLTNTVVGATYNIVCNGAVNPASIADAGHFLLTAAWTPLQVGDNITVICLNAGAGTEVFAEVARADN